MLAQGNSRTVLCWLRKQTPDRAAAGTRHSGNMLRLAAQTSGRGTKGQARPKFWGSSKPAASRAAQFGSSTPLSGRAKPTASEAKHLSSLGNLGTPGQLTAPVAREDTGPRPSSGQPRCDSVVGRMSSSDQVQLLQKKRLLSPCSSSARAASLTHPPAAPPLHLLQSMDQHSQCRPPV